MKSCSRGISHHRRSRIASRVAGAAITSLFMVFGVTHGEQPRPHADETPAAKTDPVKTLILEKLQSTILPKIDFEDTTVEEAIGYLRLRGADVDKLDGDQDPAGKVINYVICISGAATSPTIRELKLKNVSVAVLLKSICDSTKLRYTVDDTAVIISPNEKH